MRPLTENEKWERPRRDVLWYEGHTLKFRVECEADVRVPYGEFVAFCEANATHMVGRTKMCRKHAEAALRSAAV